LADRLARKVVLVVGGASGMGRVSGIAMAVKGAAVVISDVDAVRAEAVAAQIRDDGDKR
jgi:NAD(P)-dependent dehydrogenase (short-subunit alcohol dehydrogenase family)